MSEISLRSYTEYIQDRLAREAHSEVIAQCRHVLQTFPKYVEVYKLMARALMAQERYQDALDMFQRVLSADPSDFIAHVGMSDCYRESGALEQAIWHLERAFEQVPSNIEIQEAIKELYSESGKVPPRRVQLTGGALARLYLNGKLYRQAILELKKALTRDPERLDLQVLLAEALWQDHRTVEAGKVAAAVLKRLPNCISANRILAQLWLEAKQPQEARPFLERLRELDPYLAYEVEHNGQSAPADAFRLTMLDYSTAQLAADVGAADWVAQIGSIGKAEGVTGPLGRSGAITDIFHEEAPSSAEITEPPDWLKDILGGEAVPPPPPPPPTPATGPPPAVDLDRLFRESPEATPPPAPPSLEEETPAWLREAMVRQSGTERRGDETPDWLKDVLSEAPPAGAEAIQPPEEAEQKPDWLREVLSEAPPQGVEQAPPPGAEQQGTPAWLAEILASTSPPPPAGPPEQPPQAAVVSDEWLDRILTEGAPALEVSAAEAAPQPEEGAPRAGEPSEDLGELRPWDEPSEPSASAGGEEELPDWLRAAAPSQQAAQEAQAPEKGGAATTEAEAASLPPTLREGEQVAPLTEEPEGEETPQDVPEWLAEGDLDSDEAIEWLEQIAAKYDPSFGGAEGKAGEPTEEPPVRKEEEEELPEWLREPVEAARPTPAGEEEKAGEEELPEWLREPVATSLRDEDFAWLDEQVAEHGVSPAEVVSEALVPDRPPMPAPSALDEKAEAEPVAEEELPDWLKEAGAQEQIAKALEEAPEAQEAELEFAPAEVSVEEDELAWLQKALESEEIPETAEEGLEEVFKKAEVPAAAQPVAEAEEEEEEALPDWLKGIGEAVEEKPPAPAAEEKPAPIPTLEAEEEEELPAWLRMEEVAEEEKPPIPAPVGEEEAPAPTLVGELEEELPDWLKGIGEPLEAAAEVVEEEKVVEAAPPVAEAAPAPVAEVAEAAPKEEVAPTPVEEKEAAPTPVEAAIPPEIVGDYHEQLRLAREKLNARQIEAALPYYENLIRHGQMLSQTISDLTFALRSEQKLSPRVYRVLGDALRSEGRLQEALKAYRDALDQL